MEKEVWKLYVELMMQSMLPAAAVHVSLSANLIRYWSVDCLPVA